MIGNQKMDYRILKLRRGMEKLESWVSSLEQEVGRTPFLPADDSLPQGHNQEAFSGQVEPMIPVNVLKCKSHLPHP